MSETKPEPVAWASSSRMRNNIVSHRSNSTFQIPLYPASGITSLMEENERLIARVNELKECVLEAGDHIAELSRLAEAAEARAQAAEQRVKDAVKVLEPFALILTEGVAKRNEVYTSITTCTDYFRAARRFIKEAGECSDAKE